MTYFTLGVEEELYICSKETGEMCRYLSKEFHDKLGELFGNLVDKEEFLCEFELKTPICENLNSLKKSMLCNRAKILSVAQRFELGVLSNGIHPLSQWERQTRHSDDRTIQRLNNYGMFFSRGTNGSFHLHIGLYDKDLRAEICYLISPFIPVIAALSANSPIYESVDTGFASYRLNSINSRPRGGFFPKVSNYDSYIQMRDILSTIINSYVDIENVEFAFKFLGYVRPSDVYPTIEFRLFDGSPVIDRIIPIFAFVYCLTHHIYNNIHFYRSQRILYSEAALEMNAWLSAKYGLDAEILAPNNKVKYSKVSVRDFARQLIGYTVESAQELDCLDELNSCLEILEKQSLWETQRIIYWNRIRSGDTPEEAASFITKQLIFMLEEEVFENNLQF